MADLVIIAARVDGEARAKGSKLYLCSECRSMVWLAPSGQKKAAGNRIICLECFIKRSGDVSVDDFHPITDEQRQELRETLGHEPPISIEGMLAWARRKRR